MCRHNTLTSGHNTQMAHQLKKSGNHFASGNVYHYMMRPEITILEDDQDIREIFIYLFTSEGYKVNGFASVSAFSESPTSPSYSYWTSACRMAVDWIFVEN